MGAVRLDFGNAKSPVSAVLHDLDSSVKLFVFGNVLWDAPANPKNMLAAWANLTIPLPLTSFFLF